MKQWRDQLLEAATGIFGDAGKADAEPVVDVKELHAKIGQLTLEKDFLSGALGKAGAPYILHPLRVMLAQKTDEARIVGVLHDVVEDCEG